MEVGTMIEMFDRSENLHDVKYVNYIGDGDSKTYTAIRKTVMYDKLEAMCKTESALVYES
jgi:hypothetical protein